MSDQNKQISVTFELLEQILAAGLSTTTTRLLISMIYMQDRENLWRSDEYFIHKPQDAKMWAFGAELRALVGPTGSNNAKSLKKLIEEVDGRGLFDAVSLTDRNTQIHWQFSRDVHEMMACRWLGPDFALLDLDKVRACGSIITLDLYCRVRNLRKKRVPEFELPLEVRWRDYRQKFLGSLQQVVTMENTIAFVGLEWVRRAEGRQRLLVRLRHKGTTWYPDKIRYWSMNARVFRVSSNEIAEIDGRNLRQYALPGESPGQVEANLRKNLAE
ncbi:hypothetical protein [Thioclava electrotropha]|uniref:WYL domain-containing protein n=1 Tax=Thioclava electrotropha TaxID=1549850 RepID=A0ABX6YWJ4_9RHOB|nr:hypothetical protein [Thioclava electrotropha]QPZ91573.1 hypothetical protein AKL02_012150 [Thioclava electrotropha]